MFLRAIFLKVGLMKGWIFLKVGKNRHRASARKPRAALKPNHPLHTQRKTVYSQSRNNAITSRRFISEPNRPVWQLSKYPSSAQRDSPELRTPFQARRPSAWSRVGRCKMLSPGIRGRQHKGGSAGRTAGATRLGQRATSGCPVAGEKKEGSGGCLGDRRLWRGRKRGGSLSNRQAGSFPGAADPPPPRPSPTPPPSIPRSWGRALNAAPIAAPGDAPKPLAPTPTGLPPPLHSGKAGWASPATSPTKSGSWSNTGNGSWKQRPLPLWNSDVTWCEGSEGPIEERK